MDEVDKNKAIIPLFIKSDNSYEVVQSDYDKLEVKANSVLVYMGEKVEGQAVAKVEVEEVH